MKRRKSKLNKKKKRKEKKNCHGTDSSVLAEAQGKFHAFRIFLKLLLLRFFLLRVDFWRINSLSSVHPSLFREEFVETWKQSNKLNQTNSLQQKGRKTRWTVRKYQFKRVGKKGIIVTTASPALRKTKQQWKTDERYSSVRKKGNRPKGRVADAPERQHKMINKRGKSAVLGGLLLWLLWLLWVRLPCGRLVE